MCSVVKLRSGRVINIKEFSELSMEELWLAYNHLTFNNQHEETTLKLLDEIHYRERVAIYEAR